MLRHRVPSEIKLLTRPVMIVAAHPDDEVISLGARLPTFRRVLAVVHVTDGAPRTGPDVRDAGFNSWTGYADCRRRELQRALREAGVRNAPALCLQCPDQQAASRIVDNAQRLAKLFRRFRPYYVLTHSYEGGHPDHDAVAASVRLAQSIVRKQRGQAPEIIEFASYHNSPAGMETERFLPRPRWPAREYRLTPGQHEAKLRLFACYASQRRVLTHFPALNEPVRAAPDYDFTRAPHPGKLMYETFGWNLDGRWWRRRAAHALRALNSILKP